MTMNGWMKLAAALFAAASFAGCSLLKVAVATGDPLSKEQMNVRTMTRGFYYDMAGEVARAADSIVAASLDVNVRVAAVRWKIRATRAGVTAAMQGIPDVALADLWILCRRMNEGFAQAPDSLLFGLQSDIARDAALRLDRRAGRLARQVLPDDRYALMERFVTDYVRDNPASEGDETDNTTLAWLEYLRAAGVEQDYATGSIAEVLADVNDRLSGQTQQVTNSVSWSKDIFEMRLRQDSLRLQVGAQLDSLERSFNRIVVVAEHLPEISDKVLEELNRQATQLIWTMNASVDNAFADFDRQRGELQQYVTREREALVEQLRATGDIGDAPAVGFHIPGMFDKVLDIRKCWLQPDPSNGIRMEAKRFCVENGYTFHNARSHEGLMRNMIVRTASTGEVMVIVVFNSDDRPRITALMDHLAAKFPEITSLFYIVNTKFNDSVGDLDPVCYRGKDHIIEEMEGLRFKVGPKSFYQTNSAQAYELYKVARDFADLRPGDVLYDLYTGTGTIANFCAARCARVVGVEYVPEAIADAKVNSDLNGIENTVFYAWDMKAVLDDGFVAANGRPDVIILDPPRAGVDEPVIEVILRAAPERIVYVSCNPATQARDLQLMDAAYRVEAVQPVDMFPHTHHVENVVKLVRR